MKGKSKYLIKLLLIFCLLIAVIGSVIFVWKSNANKSPATSKNFLLREMENEIKIELEQIKKAKTTNDVDEVLVFGYKVGLQGAILRGTTKKKVLPSELEPIDYQKIVSLITQEKRELAKNKTLELRKEIAEKLNARPDLFYWPVQTSKTPKISDWYAWSFSAKENGKDYWLIVPRGHPATTINVFKDCQFYRITGVENIPITNSEGERPKKIVKLEDEITISPYN